MRKTNATPLKASRKRSRAKGRRTSKQLSSRPRLKAVQKLSNRPRIKSQRKALGRTLSHLPADSNRHRENTVSVLNHLSNKFSVNCSKEIRDLNRLFTKLSISRKAAIEVLNRLFAKFNLSRKAAMRILNRVFPPFNFNRTAAARVMLAVALMAMTLGLVTPSYGGALSDAGEKIADQLVDKYLPGGDNKVGHEAVHELFSEKNPFMASIRVFITPSQISVEQGNVPEKVNAPKVVPANPTNENAVPIEHVFTPQVVPVNPANENAAPVHHVDPDSAKAIQDSKGLIEGPVVPAPQKDVGASHPEQQRPTHEGAEHGGGSWAGPDRPDAGGIA